MCSSQFTFSSIIRVHINVPGARKEKKRKKNLAVYSLPNVRYIFTEIIQEHLSENTTETVTYEKNFILHQGVCNTKLYLEHIRDEK